MVARPGYRTTEFIVTVLVLIAEGLAAATSNLSPHWAALGASVSAGLYALSRGVAKHEPKPVVVTPPAG